MRERRQCRDTVRVGRASARHQSACDRRCPAREKRRAEARPTGNRRHLGSCVLGRRGSCGNGGNVATPSVWVGLQPGTCRHAIGDARHARSVGLKPDPHATRSASVHAGWDEASGRSPTHMQHAAPRFMRTWTTRFMRQRRQCRDPVLVGRASARRPSPAQARRSESSPDRKRERRGPSASTSAPLASTPATVPFTAPPSGSTSFTGLPW